jgi:hypothetical protein
VLMAGGHSPWEAFQWAFGIEVATFAGAAAGGIWHPAPFWQALLLANIGGTFLYLSVSGLRDLLTPHAPPVILTP